MALAFLAQILVEPHNPKRKRLGLLKKKISSSTIHTSYFFPQLREEVHLKRRGKPGRRAEGDVHVAMQDLVDVGTRNLHAPGKRGLVETQRLHPQKDLAEKHRTDMINLRHDGRSVSYLLQVRKGAEGPADDIHFKTSPTVASGTPCAWTSKRSAGRT